MTKTGAIDLDNRHIHLAIQPNELRVQQLHFGLEARGAAAYRRTTDSRTWIRRAPCTTCALVTMKPSSDKRIPEPVLRCLESSAAVLLVSRLVGRHVTGGKDLHHRWTDSIDQALERRRSAHPGKLAAA